LLVYPTLIKPDAFFGFLLPPLGLERLAAAIEDIADVRLLDLRFEPDWLNAARSFRPDVIGVNVKTTLYSGRSYHVADRLRSALPDARVILGGLHASCVPDEALAHGDAVVIGDGEQAMREIVAGHPLAEIAGLAYRDPGGNRHLTLPRALLKNLDELPPPARHLRPKNYRYAAAGLIPMDLLETSRGCSQFCPFCSPAALHEGRWRCHSVEYVLTEVRCLWERGVRYVMLTDDHFSGDLDRAKAIAEGITAAGIRMAFFCFLRPFPGRMDVKKAMTAAGFVMLSYGAESPNPEQLKRFGKGFSDAETFIRTVNDEWREAGARYIGNSFVFGDPRETAEDICRLGDYACELDPTYIEPLYSQPYPGTRYRSDLERQGMLLPHTWERFTEGRLLVKHPHLSENAMREARVEMWLRFFSPRKMVGALRVPLYLHKVVGIPLRTVLKYMKACDYSVFGCILEDKYYLPRRRTMVETYLRHHLHRFPRREREMIEDGQQSGKENLIDEFTDVLGLGPLKKALHDRVCQLDILDGGVVIAFFSLQLRGGRIVRLTAGEVLGPPDYRLNVKLRDVVSFFCGRELAKGAALFRGIMANLLRLLLRGTLKAAS
jgi:radical SAM superfamily enzyme YgiQ (UPF0313 family)